MEQSFDTSFIPQKPFFKVEGENRVRQPIPIITIVAFSIFFLMLILTGVTYYFNKKYIEEVAIKEATLKTESVKFKPSAIEELKASSARFRQAGKILKEHVALSPMIALIESATLKSVSYANFLYMREPKGAHVLRVHGKAPSYGSVLNQAETFRADSRIAAVSISNIVLDETNGTVSFDAMLSLDTKLFRYENTLANEVPPPAVATQPIGDTPPPIGQTP